MTEPTSIIVYRNPLEYYLWNSGIIFPLIASMVVAIIAVITMDTLTRRVMPFSTYRRHSGNIAMVVAAVAMGLTLWAML